MMLAEALALAASLAGNIPACVAAMESHYRLPSGIVQRIIATESGGNPSAVNRANRNGTVDYGLMQVNSSHLPRLRGYGVDEKVLLDQPCANIAVGASILRDALDETRGALIPALSIYNTGRPSNPVGVKYAAKVLGESSLAVATSIRPVPARAGILVAFNESSPFQPMDWR